MHLEHDIMDVACREPDRIAIEAGERTIRFGQLVDRALQMAAVLRDAGIGPGDPVWLLLPNSPEFLVSLLAVVQAQAVVVPVNPRLTEAEVNQLADVCPPAALIAHPDLWECNVRVLSVAHRPRVALSLGDDHMDAQPVSGASLASRAIQTDRGIPGVVFFTSGSTGRPKGILLTHTNIQAAARSAAEAFQLQPSDRTIVCMQMCHSFTFTKQMLCHLGRGATLVLAPDFFQAGVVLEIIDRFGCTTVCAVPSMYVMLLEHIRRCGLQLPTLRMLVSGGAPVPEATQIGLIDALPHAEFISSYGLSEASPFVAWLPGRWGKSKVGSVGLPAPGVKVSILNASGHVLPRGEVGEVCVQGPNVMAGYLSNPEATERALHGGMLHTGDMGWLDEDSCLYLCGRQDDMILRGAENVYPAEVENVLCGHPSVAEAAVVGIPHPVLGTDLVAYVCLKSQATVEAEALRKHCQDLLTSFKVPRWVWIVEQLPRTPNGKILRRALREQLSAQAPKGVCRHTGNEVT